MSTPSQGASLPLCKAHAFDTSRSISAILERMDGYRMARRVLMAEVSGGRVRGRRRLGWMDGVKVVLGNRGMTDHTSTVWSEVNGGRVRGGPRLGWIDGGLGQQMNDGGGCAKDRKEWRALVHM